MKLNYRNAKNAESIARFWGKPLDKPDWYKIEAKADDEAEIIVYDIIGWPFIDADAFVRDLAGIKAKNITVRINSPGGDVFDGIAIFNALKNHSANVVTRIEGIAASMASIIALAGNKVQAHQNTMMMIHDPWVMAAGNQYDFREIADILEKIGGNLLDVYYDKSNIGKRELKQMMADETWFTAKEAKERKLIDSIIEDNSQAKAQFDLSMFSHAPEIMAGQIEKHEPTRREIEKALRDVGLSLNEAKAFIAGGLKAVGATDDLLQAAQETLKKFGGY